jgi:hypothetical protein
MAGKGLREILAADGMPSMSTVFRWLAEDEEFRQLYAVAREVQATILADEILEISDDGRNDWMKRTIGEIEIDVPDHEHIQRSKLRVDSRKWLASKLAPKKYGDAVQLKHADADGEKLTLDPVARATRLAAIAAAALKQGDAEPD